MENNQINVNENGVVRKNSFSTIPLKSVHLQEVGSEIVDVYEFVPTYKAGPSGDKEDFTIEKVNKKVDSYNICKAIEERCKGQDLKSIVSRIEKTGDVSILNQRSPVYGDGRIIPSTRGEALDKGVTSANFLNKLSAKDKEELISMAKDPKKFEEFITANSKKAEEKTVKTETFETVGKEK